jgi:hypothetical protein
MIMMVVGDNVHQRGDIRLDEHGNAEKKSSGDFMESRSVQTDETGSDLLVAAAQARLIARLDHFERLLAAADKERAAAEKQRINDQAAAEKRFENLEEKHRVELAAAQQTRMNDLAEKYKGKPAAQNERVSTPAKGGLDHISGDGTKLSNFASCFMTPGTSELGLMFSIFCPISEQSIKHELISRVSCFAGIHHLIEDAKLILIALGILKSKSD